MAVQSEEKIRVKPVIKGCECSLSGIENKCRALFESGADSSYIAAFCLRSVESAVAAVTCAAIAEHGELPVLYAGGVMSDKLIADSLRKKFGADFAAPDFFVRQRRGHGALRRIDERTDLMSSILSVSQLNRYISLKIGGDLKLKKRYRARRAF